MTLPAQVSQNDSLGTWRTTLNALISQVATDEATLAGIPADYNTKIGTLSSLNTVSKSSAVAAINELTTNIGTLSSLSTTLKTSAVAAINEVNSNVGTLSSLTTTVKTSAVLAINEVNANVGTLSGLTTTSKTSAVAAINEVNSHVGTLSSLSTVAQNNTVAAINEVWGRVGNLSTLTTTSKTSAVSAINELVTSIALKAPLASPSFTGNPTAPTQAAGNNSTRIATTAYVDAADTIIKSTYATLNSPALTGTPTAPTQSQGNNSTRIATTAYVDAAMSSAGASRLLAVYTANNSNSIDITSVITSLYDDYIIQITDVSSTNSNTVFIALTSKDNGLNWDNTDTNYTWQRVVSLSTSPTPSTDRSTTAGTDTTRIELTVGATTAQLNATLKLESVNNTTFSKLIQTSVRCNESGVFKTLEGFAARSAINPINAIQFKFVSGRIATGTFKIYGIKNA